MKVVRVFERVLRLIAVVTLLGGAPALQAQSAGPTAAALRAGLDPSEREGAANPTSATMIGATSDYRYEGLVVGAVTFGTAAAVLGTLGDPSGSNYVSPVVYGLLGAAVGALIGLLVGGAISKSH